MTEILWPFFEVRFIFCFCNVASMLRSVFSFKILELSRFCAPWPYCTVDGDVRNEKSRVMFPCDEQSQSIEEEQKKLEVSSHINFVFLI